MAKIISVLCVLALIVFVSSHPGVKPTEKNTKAVVCPEGEVLSADGKCVSGESTPLQNSATDAPKKKKSHKRRKLQKKLAKEMKDIRKMVLDGLDKGGLDVPDVTCPQGQEFNEVGECAPLVKEVVNGTETVAKKSEKQLRLQKKLERELELALKKEIQNEIKRKTRKNKKNHSKADPAGKPTPSATNSKPASSTSARTEVDTPAEVPPP